MNNEEIKVMIKDCVYSEDGITYMSDKQYNNYIDIIEQLQQENQSLKKENKILRENAEHNDKVVDKVNWENLKLKEVIDKSIELNKQVIKDTKEFYRPTKDKIYGGTLINIAEQNLKILKEVK